ncbi:MAG: hypothetical protein ABJN84_12155 [Flavobacteriaceae bacterium]
MKKLFLIALFVIGLTTTVSAQSITFDSNGTPIANFSGISEPLDLIWSIPGSSDFYEGSISSGFTTYNFIVELDPNGIVLWLEIWED